MVLCVKRLVDSKQGLANLVADGISMGFSDYASTKSELEYIKGERKREEWEVDNFLQGEKDEMIGLYVKRGMTEEDATKIVDTM